MIYWMTDVRWRHHQNFFLYILILYCIKQIDSKLQCVCSVIDHKGRQNVVRTSVTHSAAPHEPLFCSYHILTSSVIYYWTDAQQLGIYSLSLLYFAHKYTLWKEVFILPYGLFYWYQVYTKLKMNTNWRIAGVSKSQKRSPDVMTSLLLRT